MAWIGVGGWWDDEHSKNDRGRWRELGQVMCVSIG